MQQEQDMHVVELLLGSIVIFIVVNSWPRQKQFALLHEATNAENPLPHQWRVLWKYAEPLPQAVGLAVVSCNKHKFAKNCLRLELR